MVLLQKTSIKKRFIYISFIIYLYLEKDLLLSIIKKKLFYLFIISIQKKTGATCPGKQEGNCYLIIYRINYMEWNFVVFYVPIIK